MNVYVKVGDTAVQRYEVDREPKVGESLRIRAGFAFDTSGRWYDVRCVGITDDLGHDVYLMEAAPSLRSGAM